MSFFILDVNVCTAHSVRPFEAEWCGAVRVWRIPFDFRNSLNSALVKLVPLSVTSVSGIPKVAKVDHIFSIVTVKLLKL